MKSLGDENCWGFLKFVGTSCKLVEKEDNSKYFHSQNSGYFHSKFSNFESIVLKSLFMKKLLLTSLFFLCFVLFLQAQNNDYRAVGNGSYDSNTACQEGDSVLIGGEWKRVTNVTPIQVYFLLDRTYYAAIDREVWLETQQQTYLIKDPTTQDTLSLYVDKTTGIDNYLLPLDERHYDNEPITPKTWRFIDFVMMDGADTTAVLWLGRPLWWMEYHQADQVGNQVWLEMPEQGIEGFATVTAINPCELDSRDDKPNPDGTIYRAIIGKFQRWTDEVWDYAFSNGDTISATPEHPFYSERQQAYIPIGEMGLGEQMRMRDGQKVFLRSKTKRNQGIEKVYNLEVYKDHNFFVGKSGFLVHNSYGDVDDFFNKYDNLKAKFQEEDYVTFRDDFFEEFKDINEDLLKTLDEDTDLVDAWIALKNTDLQRNIYWLGRTNRWKKAGLNLSYVKNGSKVKVFKAGEEVAELSDDLFKHKYSGFGGDIDCPLDITTTVIGLLGLSDNSRKIGTRYFFDVGLYKNHLPPNENLGGINILNLPAGQWTWSKNRDWIINAANRGDVIRIISDPSNPRTIWKNGIPPGESGHNGVKTVTGREIEVLENELGYVFDAVNSVFVQK